MRKNLTTEQSQLMLEWLNQNRTNLINKYPGQYIVYNETGILARDKNLHTIVQIAAQSEEHCAIYMIPKNRLAKFYSVQFRHFSRNEWKPEYAVKLKHDQSEIETSMLVDSGSEISLISYKLGQELGLTLAQAESTLPGETIGGIIEYVIRNIDITINNYSFIAPVAWLQNPKNLDISLLGREVVFDLFNIEFRQHEKTINFTLVNPN